MVGWIKLTDKETFESLEFVVCLKVLALENQDWLHIGIDVFRWLEFVSGFEVSDSHFKHIENMAIKNAPYHQIIWSLLLVAAHGE